MSKTEIISELARLSSKDLAEVKAWLDRFGSSGSTSKSNGAKFTAMHIRSPRLANRAQSKDFVKHVMELAAGA